MNAVRTWTLLGVIGLLLSGSGCESEAPDIDKARIEHEHSRREAALSARITTLEAQLAEARAGGDNQRISDDRQDREMMRLRNALRNEKALNVRARNLIGQLTDKLTRLNGELSELRQRNDKLVGLTDMNVQLHERNKKLEQENRDLRARVDKLSRQVAELQLELSRLRQQANANE
jgi:chromosome segregation ATPase